MVTLKERARERESNIEVVSYNIDGKREREKDRNMFRYMLGRHHSLRCTGLATNNDKSKN